MHAIGTFGVELLVECCHREATGLRWQRGLWRIVALDQHNTALIGNGEGVGGLENTDHSFESSSSERGRGRKFHQFRPFRPGWSLLMRF